MRKAERKLYGRHAANMMKTDVQEEHDDPDGTIENYLLKKGILQIEIEILKRKLLE